MAARENQDAPANAGKLDVFLHDLYYKKKFMFGQNRLFRYIMDNHPELNRQGLTQKYLADWLKRQEVAAIHTAGPSALAKAKDVQRRVLTAPFKVWVMDLVDMSVKAQDGYKWLLTVQDAFSKYAFAVPMKDKEGNTVKKALKEVLIYSKKTFKNLPKTIQSDNGSEFVSEDVREFLKKENVRQIFSLPGKPQSNGQIERFNGSIKRWFSMASTQVGYNNWVQLAPVFCENYNNSMNPVTKEIPAKIMAKFSENPAAFPSQSPAESKREPDRQPVAKKKFDIGDLVRLKIERDKYEKSNGLNWTRAPFKIVSVAMKKYGPDYKVATYRVENVRGDEIMILPRIFYNQDMIPYVESTTKLAHDQEIKQRIFQYIIRPAWVKMPEYLNPQVETHQPTFVVKFVGEKKPHYVTMTELEQAIPKKLNKFIQDHNVVFTYTGPKWFTWDKKAPQKTR